MCRFIDFPAKSLSLPIRPAAHADSPSGKSDACAGPGGEYLACAPVVFSLVKNGFLSINSLEKEISSKLMCTFVVPFLTVRIALITQMGEQADQSAFIPVQTKVNR